MGEKECDLGDLHARFRANENDIRKVESRVSDIESRLGRFDAGINELRRVNADTDARVGRIAFLVNDIQSGQMSLKETVNAQTAVLTKHMLEEAERQDRQIKLAEQQILGQQRLTKITIRMFVAVAVLTITVAGGAGAITAFVEKHGFDFHEIFRAFFGL